MVVELLIKRVLLATLLVLLCLSQAFAQNPPGRGGGGPDRGDDHSEDNRRPMGDIRRAGLSISDVVMARRDRPEYMLIGSVQQTNAATPALVAAGAQVLRDRNYPSLGRRGVFLSFARGLALADAQAIVAQVAPGADIDLHTVYRFAQGNNRLYAPALVGDTNHSQCRLSRPVRIGVIDGPVNPNHPALSQVPLIRESVLNRGERRPPDRHGTSVVALIVGEDPGQQITGFARGARIHAISAFTQVRGREAADLERIAAAIERLVSQDVRLINMSFAGPPNRAFEEILEAASRRGAIMIAAVGNRALDYPAFPAAAPQVIGVTALDAARRAYRRANTGGQVEFAAPGVDVYTARGRGGGYVTGTSFAAPIVTALAARATAQGQMDADMLRRSFRADAIDLGSPGRDSRFGWGMVRAPGC